MLAAAPGLIPTCVAGIRSYWLSSASRPRPIRAADKPGRNGACSCGSGRKRKGRCGVN